MNVASPPQMLYLDWWGGQTGSHWRGMRVWPLTREWHWTPNPVGKTHTLGMNELQEKVQETSRARLFSRGQSVLCTCLFSSQSHCWRDSMDGNDSRDVILVSLTEISHYLRDGLSWLSCFFWSSIWLAFLFIPCNVATGWTARKFRDISRQKLKVFIYPVKISTSSRWICTNPLQTFRVYWRCRTMCLVITCLFSEHHRPVTILICPVLRSWAHTCKTNDISLSCTLCASVLTRVPKC